MNAVCFYAAASVFSACIFLSGYLDIPNDRLIFLLFGMNFNFAIAAILEALEKRDE